MTRSKTDPSRGDVTWTVLVATASVLFSFGFACATPFAAIATVAATQMDRRRGFTTVLLAWAGNQAIGYGLLHYPRTANSLAWGVAIGLAGVLALVAARASSVRSTGVAAVAAAALAAFVGYEGLLYATSLALGSGSGAFTAAIVARIAAINAVALAGLLLLHRACLMIGMSVPGTRTVATR